MTYLNERLTPRIYTKELSPPCAGFSCDGRDGSVQPVGQIGIAELVKPHELKHTG
jgi:hypothetical protein